jgi:inhibitor of KinA sporulation pathway (predicted exonuclease)
MQGQPSKGWVAAHTEHRAAFPSVVIEGLKSDVVLDSFGFYVRPKFSPYVSPHTACKSVARQWMNAYDDDLPPFSTVALGARQARS